MSSVIDIYAVYHLNPYPDTNVEIDIEFHDDVTGVEEEAFELLLDELELDEENTSISDLVLEEVYAHISSPDADEFNSDVDWAWQYNNNFDTLTDLVSSIPIDDQLVLILFLHCEQGMYLRDAIDRSFGFGYQIFTSIDDAVNDFLEAFDVPSNAVVEALINRLSTDEKAELLEEFGYDLHYLLSGRMLKHGN